MHFFCPEIWTEDPTPEAHKDCRECELYRQGSRMVWGEGNPKAPVMFILDNPGAREDREGSPFVCGTRQTLQTAANEAGMASDQLYMTYILKRRPIRAYDKPKTRAICMNHLLEQLQKQQPALVVCFGNVAVQSFFRNPELEVKSLRGSWQQVNGYPTAVTYHPLAARRRPNLYPLLLEDMRLVASRLLSLKPE